MITNEDVYHFWYSYNGLAKNSVRELCARHSIAYVPSMDNKTLSNRLKRTAERCKKLTKSRSDPYWSREFEFTIMPTGATKPAPTPEEHVAQVNLNKELKRKVASLEISSDMLCRERANLLNKTEALTEMYERCTVELAKTLETAAIEKDKDKEQLKSVYEANNKELGVCREDIAKLEKKVASMSVKSKDPKALKQKIRRRDDKIKMLTEDFETKRSLLDICEKRLLEQETGVSQLGQEKRKLMLQINYLKTKFAKNHPGAAEIEMTVAEEIDQLNRKVKVLEDENRELNELAAILNSEEVVCFENGKYTDDLRLCVMDLLRQNVAMRNIGPVIQTVMHNLTGKQLDRLPSKTVAGKILKEANFLAKAHVAECMLEGLDATVGNCLSSDGTTKFHRKYQSFQVTTVSGKTLSIGMKDLAGGDAAEAMASFQHTMQDIAETITTGSNIGHLIASLKNTMSDKCSVNHVFNAQLSALRTTLLPQVIDDWEGMTDSQREDMQDMGHFFCRMHILVNMALECDKTSSELDAVTLPNKAYTFALPVSGESGAGRLVRTAVKALHPRGCEQSGAAADFLAFLHEKERLLMLVPYKGNRFNILFYNAAAVYYHRTDIKEFIEYLPTRNRLLSAVLEDVLCNAYVAGVRALGILDKFVTAPYWRKLNASANILALNEPLNELRLKLEDLAVDSSPLLDGTFKLYEDVDIHVDAMYDRLLTPDETDATTQTYLEALMHSLLLILERQAEDQLPSGKHYNASEALKKSAANVPTTNIISERDFGSLDMLLRMKPAASTYGLESLIMWSNNKTAQWYRQMNESDREVVMQKARKSNAITNRFKERKEEVKRSRLEQLKRKQQSKVDKEGKQYTKRVEITKAVEGKKICYSDQDVALVLANLDEKATTTELILQLNYHQQILKSKGERRLFAKSHKGKAYTNEELKRNLIEITNINVTDHNSASATVTEPAADADAYQSLKAELIERREKDWDSRMMAKEKQKLSMFMNDPGSLAGKQIKHKCVGDEGTEWFAGIVRDMVEIKENVMRIEYNVVYEEYVGEVWTFNLLQDLKNGDLKILN